LEKWASSQLGTSQKNYEEAMRRASSGGVTAALQNLAARRPEVEFGVQSDYRKILDELARERAQAEAEAGSAYDEAVAAANQLKAETTSKYAPAKPKPKPKEQPAKGSTPKNTTPARPGSKPRTNKPQI
jgi:heme-binding NEAT domain protein